MLEEMTRWETSDGPLFLRQVGLRDGDVVLDFGAHVGRYAIPAARVVGPRGLVYAIDKDQKALCDLERKAAQAGLANIRCIRTSGDIRLDVGTGTVDVCFCHDILHLVPKPGRVQLYDEIRRVLKGGGWLSVYPAHVAGVDPAEPNYLGSLTIDDVIAEIEGAGLAFDRRICGTLSHEEGLAQGCVFNFRK